MQEVQLYMDYGDVAFQTKAAIDKGEDPTPALWLALNKLDSLFDDYIELHSKPHAAELHVA